jgi:hypothetical protein
MQNSRDSSVWKSLAVAFGDGVAFAVGMKLSQRAVQPSEKNGRPEPAPRLEPPPAPPFDRKVVEAVVNAVDERLKEHAGQVERRIAELEAKLALELKSLGKQDEALVSALEEVRTGCETRIAALREELAAPGGASRDLLLAIGQACRNAAER